MGPPILPEDPLRPRVPALKCYMAANYDIIGIHYAALRRPDPRIGAAVHEALGSAQTVLNVGAGTGSYEPADRVVTAIEPSLEMIRRRRPSAAPVIQACAEHLPFDDDAFDAAMAILTIHHWRDKQTGLHELRRVTQGRIVLLTFDPAHRPWLTDYFPELIRLDEARLPPIPAYEQWLGPVQVTPVLVPHDCSDGFLYSYWRRPAAYLDAKIRSGSSAFWAISDLEAGLERLKRDLETGEWQRRYADLLTLDTHDAGYRLVVAE